MLTIIDYSVGNLSSIQNMCKRIGVDAMVSNSVNDILTADKLILPGVGSFDYGMGQLEDTGILSILNERVLERKVPILGICLGAQLLTESSEEGKRNGLGWIKGRTVAFNRNKLGSDQKIPHMGWSDLKDYRGSKLFSLIEEPRYYFVHSYHLKLSEVSDVLASVNYGYDFTAGIERENILGVQFHPEKSHKFGMMLIDNFIKHY